jgi:hypothetical protein
MRAAGWLLAAAVSTPAAAAALDGAKAALQATFAHVLGDALAECLASSDCRPAADERSLLEKISRDYARSLKTSKLEFVRAADRPDLFQSPETPFHRLSVTGLSVGSTIFFNLDALQEILRTHSDFGIPEAGAILAHELGHHQNVRDGADRVLDRVGARVRLFLEARRVRTDELAPQWAGFSVETWSLGGPAKLLFRHPTGVSVLNQPGDERLSCIYLKLPGTLLREEPSSPNWSEPSPADGTTTTLEANIEGLYRCRATNGAEGQARGGKKIRFQVRRQNDGSFAYVPKSVFHFRTELDPFPPIDEPRAVLDSTQAFDAVTGRWTVSARVRVPETSPQPEGCRSHYQAIHAPMQSRWTLFSNFWPARSCRLHHSGPDEWTAEIVQDFPPGSPDGRYALRSLVLVDANAELSLPFPRRPEITVDQSVAWTRLRGTGWARGACRSPSPQCFGRLTLTVPSTDRVRLYQVFLASFDSSEEEMRDTYVVNFTEGAGENGLFASVHTETSNGSTLVSWDIPQGHLARGRELVLLGYRIVTDRYTIYDSGDVNYFEIIRP